MSEEKEVVEVTTESTEKKFQLTPKAKKIINIVVDIVCGAVLLFALILAVFTIRSKTKGYPGGYTEIFGKAYLAVESDSMNADKPDWVPEGKYSGFKKGDLVTIRTLSASEAAKLEVGDVITFKYPTAINGKYVLNTHRIVSINKDSSGKVTSYNTQGDNREVSAAPEITNIADVIGIYQGKTGGIGKLFLFMNSSAGFFVCIVTPTLIVVVYCIINLILVIKREKKAQAAAANEEKEAEEDRINAERERIRAELLAEMQGFEASKEQTAETVENQESQPQAVVVADEVVENKQENAESPVEEKAEEVKAEEKKEEVAEEKAETVETAEKKPAAKKATTAKTTAKSASSKTAGAKTATKPATAKSTGTKTAAKSTTTKAAGAKTAAKPAATKSAGTKAAAKNTKKDS